MGVDGLVMLEKMEDVCLYARVALRQFPKVERFQLGAEIRDCMATIKRMLIRVFRRKYKRTTLDDIDIELDVLRSLIREAYRLKYIDTHKYETWSKIVGEVGRMLGAWKARLDGQPRHMGERLYPAATGTMA